MKNVFFTSGQQSHCKDHEVVIQPSGHIHYQLWRLGAETQESICLQSSHPDHPCSARSHSVLLDCVTLLLISRGPLSPRQDPQRLLWGRRRKRNIRHLLQVLLLTSDPSNPVTPAGGEEAQDTAYPGAKASGTPPPRRIDCLSVHCTAPSSAAQRPAGPRPHGPQTFRLSGTSPPSRRPGLTLRCLPRHPRLSAAPPATYTPPHLSGSRTSLSRVAANRDKCQLLSNAGLYPLILSADRPR
ncbi:hypothetical protein NDU88_003677 [Pleurodeles waltl]|uniref:Uncharacterized protein n=1 Tax=Pleurodeles waltl TaxID=8319 RepID=A0AAV7LHQ8_PLEWA|nr:hypothetical protein NDU88_003677 [Pleurodeles waltl]